MTEIKYEDLYKNGRWFGIEVDNTISGSYLERVHENTQTGGYTIAIHDEQLAEMVVEALQKVYGSKENLEKELKKRKFPVNNTFGGLGGLFRGN